MLGFVAGAAAMLTFHQAAVALFAAYDAYPVGAFNTAAVGPLGVPGFVSGAFWSGVFGAVFAGLFQPRMERVMPRWLAGPVYCATVPITVLFLILAPLRGFPLAFGMPATLVLNVIIAHAMWGFGLVLWQAGLPALKGAARGPA
jgi:hypothetical protein